MGGPFAPYTQSERLPLYRQAADDLIARGRAYRCFCTAERLDQMRAAQAAAKQPPGYDGHCRDIAPDVSADRAAREPHTVRFKMRREGVTVLDDLVRGRVTFENALQDDFVALKSDGYPTYHLALIVDDTAMQITHAIRGEEWISSAPKHLQLYEALGLQPTKFAHLPLIMGPDHKKLSKRTGDTALLDYRRNGYLPEAMINFLALLGWSLDATTSIVTVEDLTRNFSLERVVPNPAVFDIDRLNFLNGHYIRQIAPHAWIGTVTRWAERTAPEEVTRPLDPAMLAKAAPLLQERVARLDEIGPQAAFLFGFEAPNTRPRPWPRRSAGTSPMRCPSLMPRLSRSMPSPRTAGRRTRSKPRSAGWRPRSVRSCGSSCRCSTWPSKARRPACRCSIRSSCSVANAACNASGPPGRRPSMPPERAPGDHSRVVRSHPAGPLRVARAAYVLSLCAMKRGASARAASSRGDTRAPASPTAA